jgi:phosphatidylinositol alpha-1,6-mannosyltransferase
MNNKLIIFSYDFPPSNGGIARLCQEIAVGMHKYYNEVTVLTLTKEGVSKPYNSDKVNVKYLPSKRIKAEIAAYKYLTVIKDKENYHVLCGLWHPEASIAMLAGFKNVFILGHGTEFLSGKSNFKKYFWLPFYAKSILGRAKLTIANSKYTEQLIHNINKKANISALPLGVNEQFFKPYSKIENKDILKVSSLSRILQFKGYDFIAKTIAKLPIEYREKIEWHIGGTGPYLIELKELVKSLQIEHLVLFHGFIADEDLPQFYSKSDLFVLCTREVQDSSQVEGFGLVFLEAQACGIPAVGVKSGGIPDAIEHKNGGWLIKQDNFEDLSYILIECLSNKSILNTQSINARKRVEEGFTWDIYNDKLYKMLNT